jgi:chitin disaccharide deacetylase
LTARLIVTADDVGLHPGMTEGALRAHREGIVTACSISANGRFVEAAAAAVRDHPGLAPGIHLTLVGEAPVSPPAQVRSLLAGDGRLLPSWTALVRRHALGRLDLDQVELELRAQVARLRALGVAPVHLNGHQHLHVLPGIFDRVLTIAADQGIAYVRIPHESSRPASALRWMALAGLERCGRLARRRAEARGARFAVADTTPGIALAGRLDLAALLRIVPRIQGLAELVVHPGVGGATIAKDYAWGYLWDGETASLCSKDVREALTARGIELQSMPLC